MAKKSTIGHEPTGRKLAAQSLAEDIRQTASLLSWYQNQARGDVFAIEHGKLLSARMEIDAKIAELTATHEKAPTEITRLTTKLAALIARRKKEENPELVKRTAKLEALRAKLAALESGQM